MYIEVGIDQVAWVNDEKLRKSSGGLAPWYWSEIIVQLENYIFSARGLKGVSIGWGESLIALIISPGDSQALHLGVDRSDEAK